MIARRKLLALLISVLSFFPFIVQAQTYGLTFSGQDVNKDKRTGIDLNPESPFEFTNEFELSFDISYNPDKLDYFGYIVRIIIDNTKNFDLISNVRDLYKKDFSLVAESKLTDINFDLPKQRLFDHWKTFKVRFDLKNDEISFFTDSISFVQKHVGLNKKVSCRIMFGANTSDLFKTTDVPDMKIRDIRISQQKNDLYYWPLNEKSGNVALDEKSGSKAVVMNPHWVAYQHLNWRNVRKFSLGGRVQVAFDPGSETVYLCGKDSLIKFSPANDHTESIRYAATEDPVMFWDQAFFDTSTRKLYRFSTDNHVLSYFDFGQHHWKENIHIIPLGNETSFWHHNKIVSAIDSSLYIFGGYGHHKYKNTVQKLNLFTGLWTIVKNNGDTFKPRYLSAAGLNASGDTVFIIGGYGSESGEQILNPGNYYDLVSYSIKTHTFKELYKLQVNGEDFSFGNSMVIDKENHHFYGLTFPQNKFDCNLQLLEGDLKSREYHWVGSKFPYRFYDIKSFADLFYCPQSKLLMAVTIYLTDQNVSEINVFTIKYPPNLSEMDHLIQNKAYSKWVFLWLLGILPILFFAFWIFVRIKKRSKQETFLPVTDEIPEGRTYVPESRDMSFPDVTPEPVNRNAVVLFGDFQVINRDGTDITKKFSPLLRELFLLILLYSLKHSKGISVEKLDEFLWFDKDERSARNNRAVNIAKLKELINELSSGHLANNGGYWKIESEAEQLYIDYQKIIRLVHECTLSDVSKIKGLLEIMKKGPFLTNLSYEWLDNFKAQLTNDLIDLLVKYGNSANVNADPNFMIEIADALFQLDAVNEDAMILKGKALIALGKHSLAKQTYTKFVHEYKLLYNEEYKTSFVSIFKV